jgi:hypothetical protein
MSEAGTTNPNPSAAQAPERVTELKVSGHLMTLDTGVFCVFQAPGPAANDRSGLPAVRISLPPGAPDRADILSISTFRSDGWLDAKDGAALVRVGKGPTQVLVTVYQAPTARPEAAPRLQVMRLGGDQAANGRPGGAAQASVPLLAADAADVVIHVQRTGDQASRFNEWAGTRGSRQWIEGFSVTPHEDLKAEDIEYQAVLGRGWMSPWIEGGKFCGSRGMALPLLGLKVRLKGAAAKSHECSYSASFVDGSLVGPVPSGETCEAESLAALEAFQIMVRSRGGAASAKPAAPKPTAKRAAPKKAAR